MPANDNGCRYGHHRRRWSTNCVKIREVDRNKLITTFIYDLICNMVLLRPRILSAVTCQRMNLSVETGRIGVHLFVVDDFMIDLNLAD
jgi:hypothetical protein